MSDEVALHAGILGQRILDRWVGRVALVTGASSGIGAASARALAQGGMRVAVTARRAERLEALKRALPTADLLVLPGDLRDPKEIRRVFDEIDGAWGGVDVLVNCAGLGHLAPLIDGSPELWREVLEVNVLGLSICTQHAVSQMRARGDDGHIIHIGSMAGHRVPRGSGMYAASKFAVRALTEGLRQELRALGSSIRVSAISPGFVETEFAANYYRSERTAEEIYGRYEVLQPEEIASAVCYALELPAHVQVHDILLRPTRQES